MFSLLKLPARRSMRTVTLTLMTWVMSAFFAISTLGLTTTATWARSPEFGPVYISQVVLEDGPPEVVIRVGHVGGRWSTIRNPDVEIPFRFGAYMNKGYVIDVFFGRSTRGSEEISDRYGHRVRASEPARIADFMGNIFHNGSAGNRIEYGIKDWRGYSRLKLGTSSPSPNNRAYWPGVQVGDFFGIINACNQAPSGTGAHTTTYEIPIFMQVDARSRKSKQEGSVGSTKRKHRGRFKRKRVGTNLKIKVECEAPPQRSPAPLLAPPKPYSVDLRVTQQGASCPKRVEVRAFIKYRRPATAKFRFKVDGKLSELHEIRARKLRPQQGVPGDTYLVERVKYYNLDPGQTNFRIEVRGGKKSKVKTVRITCPPFAASGMWMSVKQQSKSTCPKNVNLKVLVNANRPGSVLTRIKNQAGVVMAIESVKVRRKGDYYEGV